MRRIKLVVGVAALMAAMITASAIPALANDNNHNFFFDHNNIDHNNNNFFDHHNFFPFFENGFNNNGASLGFEQEAENTGNVTTTTNVTSTGNNSNQCVAPLQFGNTGNVQNAQGFLQYNSTADDIEFEGSSMTFAPTLTNTCDQSVQQAAAAGN